MEKKSAVGALAFCNRRGPTDPALPPQKTPHTQVIILTTTSLVLIGLISFWIARIARDDSERAEEVNSASQLGLFCFYVLFNVRLFIPVMIRQQSQMRLLQQEDPVPPQVSPRPVTVSDSHAPDETGERASIKRYTVHDDAKYFTWKGLKGLN